MSFNGELRVVQVQAELVRELNRPVLSVYEDFMEYPPLHKKGRGRHERVPGRCGYCWRIPERSTGVCEGCGAPL